MEPLTTMVSMGADFAYLYGQLPEKDVSHISTAAATAFMNNINSNQFLQAVGQLYEIMSNGSTDSQWDMAAKFIRTRLTSAIPAVIKEVASGQEQQRVLPSAEFQGKTDLGSVAHRELRVLVDTLWRNAGQVDPNTIKYDRNMFTGDILINDSWPFNPYTVKGPEQAASWAVEIRRLNGAGLRRLPDWIGSLGPADIGMSDKPEAPGVRLSGKQLDRMEVLMTQVVKDSHGKLIDSLDQLVKSDTYKRVDNDHVREDLIHERWISFRLRAEDALRKEDPKLDEAIKLHTGLHQIEKYMPRGRQPAARMELELRHGGGREPSPGAQP
jgi:hypothetical protein